jgi:hypothetical protein
MSSFKRFQSLVFLSAPLMLLFVTCKNNPIKPEQWHIQLTIEDASCTEAYLKLQVGTELSERTVTLKRDNVELWTRVINAAETAITDTNLLPGHSYTYTARLISPPPIWTGTNSTSQVQVRTMDTTSHNFTWQTFTLGDGTGSSVLYDVAIINDTLAYAVGEIHRNDTTFNFAKWNGYTWELIQIQFLYFCDQSGTFSFPAQAVWAFSENDIWIASGSQIVRWNGQNQTSPVCIPVSVNKLWGENSSSMYAVGYGGGIAHYNGSTWTKLESGTTLGLSGIFGLDDNTIYACGLDYNLSKGIVLRRQGQSWGTVVEGDIIDSSQLFKPKLYGITEGLWIDEKGTVYTVGNFMYQFKRGKWDYVSSLPGNILYGNSGFLYRGYLHAIRGNASNDIVIAGEINTVRHFNGVSWVQVGEPYQPLNYNAFWYSCDIKNNMMIAVGDENGRATILLARR